MPTTNSQRLLFTTILFIFAALLSACSMTPEKVFAKYAQATNPSTIEKPKSISMRMTVTHDSSVSPLDRPADTKPTVRMHAMNIYCEFPDKIYLDSDAVLVQSQGAFANERKFADIKVVQAFDGQTGWEITSSPQSTVPARTRNLPFFEVDKLKNMVDGAFAVNQLEKINTSKYIGEQEVQFNEPTNGNVVKKKAHVVEAMLKGGKKQVLYFDMNDGFLIKTETIDSLSNEKVTAVMTNYKQFGKVKLPSRIQMTSSSSAESTIFNLEEMSFDVPAPSEAFVKPTIY